MICEMNGGICGKLVEWIGIRTRIVALGGWRDEEGIGRQAMENGVKAYSSSESAYSVRFVRGYHRINKCRQNSLQSSKRRRGA